MEGQPKQQEVQSELVLTPAVELLIAQKPCVMQVSSWSAYQYYLFTHGGYAITGQELQPTGSLAEVLCLAHLQVLEDVRFDKIAAVRTTAAAAWAEFTALPDPVVATDATPAGKSDKATAGSKRAASKPSGASPKRSVGAGSPMTKGR